MSRILSFTGIVITTAYLLVLVILFQGRIDEIRLMAPNNIGDFLAGAFGPLAILWLILGFFQQGIELRQNTRALELQAQELQNSVAQQRELVEVSRKQVDAELEVIHIERERQKEAARPNFVFHGVGGAFTGLEGTYSSRIKNLGNTATDIQFSYDPPMRSSSLTIVFSWSRGEEQRIEWRYETLVAEKPSILTISYIDASGLPGIQKFEFLPVASEPHTMVEVRAWRG
ncbi:MAG: hypothetical protein B7Y41_09505 [Hydrogenophilales bacterium 28-61-23]|nr:MAG: hypothetical protein B7Y41_09505 [Hydrogenophilales bacterium 28-61-23]